MTVGIRTAPIGGNERLSDLGLDAYSSGSGIGAAFEESLHLNPAGSLWRMLERDEMEQGAIARVHGRAVVGRERVDTIEPDEANALFGIGKELHFDATIPRALAAELHRVKRDELRRRDMLRRSEPGFIAGAARFAAGMGASVLDPINIASAFIPAIGPARYAAWLARTQTAIGKAGVRAGVGAIEGAAGAALVEPIVYLGARAERADYDAVDSLLNIAFGTVLGGGLHAGGGALVDRVTGRYREPHIQIVAEAPQPAREASLRGAVAAVAEDRPVSRIDEVLASAPPRRVPIIEADPADVAGSIQRFAAEIEQGGAATTRPGMSRVLDAGEVAPAVAARIAGEHPAFDLRGYRLVFQSDEVRHALKRHGAGGEALEPDQIPITAADIARVPEIVGTADAVSRDINERGQPVLIFSKREGNTIIVIEEVRTKRRRLAFLSMRIKREGSGPGTSDAPPGAGSSPRSLRPEPIPGTADEKIGVAGAARNPMAETPDEARAAQEVDRLSAEAPKTPEAETAALEREIAELEARVAPDIAAVGGAAPGAGAAPESAADLTTGMRRLDPDKIEVDAKRFQFKSGADEAGITERLRGVEAFDERLAGAALVYEQKDGRIFIVDGHQRLALARRAKAAGDPNALLNAFVLREADGISPSDARALAAVKNIAEGTGSAVDAAKVLREAGPEGLKRLPPLPPTSALVRDARGLARLGDDAFLMIVNEVVPAPYAAIVGRLIEDPGLQLAALDVLAKTDPANAVQADSIVRQVIEAGAVTEKQQTLFGDETITSSLFGERAKVLDAALKRLRQDRKTFNMLMERAGAIEAAGNVLAKESNVGRAEAAARLMATIAAIANRKGAVSDALTQAARDFKQTGRLGESAGAFLDAVAREAGLGVFARAEAGGGGRGDEAGGPGGLFGEQAPALTPADRASLEDAKTLTEAAEDEAKALDAAGNCLTRRG